MREDSREETSIIAAIGWCIGLAWEIALLANLSAFTAQSRELVILISAPLAAGGGLLFGLSLCIGFWITQPDDFSWKRCLLLILVWMAAFGGFLWLYGHAMAIGGDSLLLIQVISPPLFGAVGGRLTGMIILAPHKASPHYKQGVMLNGFGWAFSLFIFQWLYVFVAAPLSPASPLGHALIGVFAGLIAGVIGGYITAWQGDKAYSAARTKYHSTHEKTKTMPLGDLLTEPGTSGTIYQVIDERKEKPKRKPKPTILHIHPFVKALIIAFIVVAIIWWLVAPVRQVTVVITPSVDYSRPTPPGEYDQWDWNIPLRTNQPVYPLGAYRVVWITAVRYDNSGALYTIRTAEGAETEARDYQLSPLPDYTALTPPVTETLTPTLATTP